MTLYEMSQAAQTLYDLYDNEEIDEKVVKDTLEGMGAEIKLEDYCKVIRQLESETEQFKAEAARMKKRQASLEKSVKRLNSALLNNMDATRQKTAKAGVFSIRVSESKAVNITDEKQLPKEFLIEQPAKVDKEGIRKLLMAGKTLSGAELQINRNIQIK